MTEEKREYPGPEMFWRDSPELIEMQNELRALWKRLERVQGFPEEELLKRKEGDVVGIKTTTSQYQKYTLLELARTPTEQQQYLQKPFYIMPKLSLIHI